MGAISSTSLVRFAAAAIVLLPFVGTVADAQPTKRSLVLKAVSEPAPHSRTIRYRYASRRSTDRWLARDKLKHLTFSFLWTLSAQYVLVDKADWSNRSALPVSAGSSAAMGLSKELFDWRLGPTGRFSTRDLAADALGIVLAVGVIVL